MPKNYRPVLTKIERAAVREALPAFREASARFSVPSINGGGPGKFQGESADSILARHGITLGKRYCLVVEELCRRARTRCRSGSWPA
jgi:hypothetical protein